ncbi:MAG: NAD(P)/FAD-dependent oxidoreductase [Candidatus Thorarchaeota archaeon]|nr:NAD(P)/FAD-dependent oxidoreductase [Candidatus Thorarchaeota archaeon]
MTRIGIMGNGVAAVTAIREIRKLESSVTIDVFSDEKYAYYPKPKLIEFIAGRIPQEKVIQYDVDWYRKQDISLHLDETVVRIELSSRSLLTRKSTHFSYDRLLVVPGSIPLVPPIHGTEKKNVYVLRTLDDAISIKEAIATARRAIVIGGGILGIELAAAMKARGRELVVINNIARLLPQQLDDGASSMLAERLKATGLELLLGFNCEQIIGHESVTGVMSSGGDKVKGDMVVIAAGVRPNKTVAQESGLLCGRGVKVDSTMKTSADGVYAAGDCIEWNGQTWGIIPAALETGRVAAQNIVQHGSAAFDGIVPSNTLQVAGIDLTSLGVINPLSTEYESIVSSDADAGTYFKAVLKDHVVVGGIALGDKKVALKLRQLVTSGTDVTDMRESIFET